MLSVGECECLQHYCWQDVPEYGMTYSSGPVADQRSLKNSLSGIKGSMMWVGSSKQSKTAQSSTAPSGNATQALSADAAANKKIGAMPSVEVAVHELQVAAEQDDTLEQDMLLQADGMPGGAAGGPALPGAADDEAIQAVAAANESSSLPAGLKSAHLAAVFQYTSKHLLRCYPSGIGPINCTM
jgi:hypothetical protein